MKAVILAAGEGKRMRPLTLGTPKVLLRVWGRPLVDYILESLGPEIDEVIIVIDYLGNQIKKYVGRKNRGMKITYVKGSEKGNAYSFMATKKCFKKNERFLLIYGDEMPKAIDVKNCLSKDLSMLTFNNGVYDGVMVLNTDIFNYVDLPATDIKNFNRLVRLFMSDHKVSLVESKDFMGEINRPRELKGLNDIRWPPAVYMDELSKLALKYGTGKCPQISHSYTPYYYEMFRARRKNVKKVLEIGIGRKGPNKKGISKELYPGWAAVGPSLRMWRDFFPNAQIYGADISPECIFEDERIETFWCDQNNKKSLKELIKKTGGDIDIVIDDGSHTQKHQFRTCLTLMPLLKKDVIYIIEDVGVARNIKHALENHRDKYVYEEIGFFRRNHRDDRLIIVKHI